MAGRSGQGTGQGIDQGTGQETGQGIDQGTGERRGKKRVETSLCFCVQICLTLGARIYNYLPIEGLSHGL